MFRRIFAIASICLLGLASSASAQSNVFQMKPGQMLSEMNQHLVKGEHTSVISLASYLMSIDSQGKDPNTALCYMTAAMAAVYLEQQAEAQGNQAKALEYAKASSFYNRLGSVCWMVQNGNAPRTLRGAYQYFWGVYKLPTHYIDYTFTR